MRSNGYISLDNPSKNCRSSALHRLMSFSAFLPFVAFVLFFVLPDFYVNSAASQATLCACISFGLACRLSLSSGPPSFQIVRFFAATAQCLCAVADLLSFTLTHAISSALIGKICTAIHCLALLASAVACFCTQVDVISSTSFSSNARDCLRSQPFILLSLVGVLSSAACIPFNSSAALLSCCCFCGITCFLSGFPAAVPPQSHVVIRDDTQFERSAPLSSWKLSSSGTATFSIALLGYALVSFFAPPWWMFPQELLLPLRWSGQGLWAAAASQLWRHAALRVDLFQTISS